MQNSNQGMSQDDILLAENINQAKQLVAFLEGGDTDKAEDIITGLCMAREQTMFKDLGKLTRDLHEAINDINNDNRLNDLMKNEMPNAQHKLMHVISLSEEAANKTFESAELCTKQLDSINEQASYLKDIQHERIKKLSKNNELDFVEEEIDCFLDKVCVDVKGMRKNINDIVVAQSYQDLTGQIIQRVSKMVDDLEQSLVGILKINSHFNSDDEDYKEEKNNAGYGPAVPGLQNGEIMNSQEDVDDLLSTLGF